MSAKLYGLSVNGIELCEVVLDMPDWFPARPRLANPLWLRGLLLAILSRHRSQSSS